MGVFIIGTAGMAGSDDVLACFVAGNAFTWDDWFRLETLEDSFQPVVDMLLNVAMFMWLGAVCPWESFWASEVITPWRLALLGVLVLALRRLPVILGLRQHLHQIEDLRQALIVGYFGPIGVSAIFYLYVGLEFLESLSSDTESDQDEEMQGLAEAMKVVVWFLVVCSVVSRSSSMEEQLANCPRSYTDLVFRLGSLQTTLRKNIYQEALLCLKIQMFQATTACSNRPFAKLKTIDFVPSGTNAWSVETWPVQRMHSHLI
ncbi:hypothetical protein B0T14DRAFT_517420 [Immersiella caudata]|uniref:Cation/H+ exchanger transmembrane domain-containing protein n=1 Tax=Immersiella caudata TaxID=314043 RepID=A0AA40C3T4_9PEZI|nr:hypothetical protein B0T14DRAFT_517420 [Immersiella caudata]